MTGLKLTANSERRIGGIAKSTEKNQFLQSTTIFVFRFWTARLWQIATTAASFDEISKLALRVVRCARRVRLCWCWWCVGRGCHSPSGSGCGLLLCRLFQRGTPTSLHLPTTKCYWNILFSAIFWCTSTGEPLKNVFSMVFNRWGSICSFYNITGSFGSLISFNVCVKLQDLA